ncbi:MAG: ABC transporter permease, partial [Nitrospinaceae bacterium]
GPLDRALAAQEETKSWLEKNGDARIQWSPRIRWTALMDVPDAKGETRVQTPVTGMAVDLHSPQSREAQRLNLDAALTAGRIPQKPREILVGSLLAETLGLSLGATVTLIGRSFDGGLAVDNYTVCGLIRFGVTAMDKKMAVMDLKDAQDTFYMEDMVTDWLGFLPITVSYKEYAGMKEQLQRHLKEWMQHPPAAWADDDQPIVLTILDQRNLRPMVAKFEFIRGVIITIFTGLMVLVLWNAGLLNGIHRYGEMGLRLALGETHRGLLGILVLEALAIGVVGSIAGGLVGGAGVLYLQEVGINMGDSMAQSGLMLSDVSRGRLSVEGFARGFFPGIISCALGAFLAGLGIFKRSEADLFRELEVG